MDRTYLPAGNRKPRRVLCKTNCATETTCARLADVAGDARHFGIVEGADTDAVILADKAKRRTDAGEVVGACRRCGPAQTGEHKTSAQLDLDHEHSPFRA